MIPGIIAGARKAELPQYLAAAHGSGGFSVWPVSPAGFGAKLASPSSGAPTGEGLWVGFSKTNKAIAVASRSGNGVTHAYPFNAATGTIGARMAQSSPLGGDYAHISDFHKDNNAIVFSGLNYPETHGIAAYAWSDTSGIGVKYANPSALGSGYARSAKFSKAGGAVAGCFAITTYQVLNAWAWSPSSGFGSRIANINGSVPMRDILFTDDSIIVSIVGSPFVREYLWNDSTGLRSQRAAPSALPAGDSFRMAMRKDSSALIICNEGSGAMSPASYLYTPGVGIGAAIAKAPGLPATVIAPAFSKDGDMAAFGYASSPYMSVNTFAAGAFGAKLANPATLPPAAVTYVNFSN